MFPKIVIAATTKPGDFGSQLSRSNIPSGFDKRFLLSQEGHKERREKHNSYVVQPEFHRSQ